MTSKLVSTSIKKNQIELYLQPKLLKILERASLFLRVYRSGKIPKIFKMLPNLKNFEEILWLTRPDIWSDQAIVTLTRSFLPKLDKNQASRFYSLVLAPRFMETIFSRQGYSGNIKKAIKISSNFPSVFFSSIILPICESKKCSTKEGAVLGSIIASYRFPSPIIMSVLVQLLKKPITSTKCILLRVLISKNYLIPHRIIDLLVDFFDSNKKQCAFFHYKVLLLTFLKNYSKSLSSEDQKKIIKIKK